MLGLDASGKTTILYKLKLNTTIDAIPTIGFNIETINYKNLNLNIWDVGGGNKIHALWYHYYSDMKGTIYVIDTSDIERLDLSYEEFSNYYLSKTITLKTPLLFLCNKVDIEKHASEEMIIEHFHLNEITDRPWRIQFCSAINGTGLYEGIEWLYSQIYEK